MTEEAAVMRPNSLWNLSRGLKDPTLNGVAILLTYRAHSCESLHLTRVEDHPRNKIRFLGSS